MSTAKLFGKPEDLLVEEFEQAWLHYRFIETERTQYLGFFFTVVLGSVGFGITALKDVQPQSFPLIVFGLFTILWLDYMLTVLLFTSIRKAGFVLWHYEKVIRQVRDFFYPSDQNLDALFNVRIIEHPIARMRIFSTQKAAEYLLIGACTVFTLVQIVGLVVFLQSSILPAWQIVIVAFYASTMIAMIAYVVIVPELRERRQRHNKAES